jgi:hypothetical protein
MANKYELFYTSYWIWYEHVCKVSSFIFVYIFVIKFIKIWILGISYKAKLNKSIFGQAYYVYLLKMILNKFILYFSIFLQLYANLGRLNGFPRNLNG